MSDIEIDSCEGNPIETAPDCSSLHGLDDTAEFPNEDEDEDQMEVRLSSSDEEEDIDVELSEALKKRSTILFWFFFYFIWKINNKQFPP